MALNGRLEDMTLLEILQIVAFAKKTGTLKVGGSLASGSILFRNGSVLCAFSPSTLAALKPLSEEPLDASRLLMLAAYTRDALRELIVLREGDFEFVLASSLPTEMEGIDVTHFMSSSGVDPQELMLELARELDAARKDSSTLLESPEHLKRLEAEQPEAEIDRSIGDSDVVVVLVDDEASVLETLAGELREASCTVETAASANDALELLDELASAGRALILVTDFAMPSSSGDSFEGGFELIEHLQELNGGAPALLMTESLSPDARARARRLGVRKVAFKPALTKLDADEYASDLKSFATVLKRELGTLVDAAERSQEAATVPELNHDVIFDFLRTMTAQLTNPANGIARMLLRVASRYTERAMLFLVKGSVARGLAGLHLGRPAKLVTDRARELSFDLQQAQPFAEVVYSRQAVRGHHETAPLPAELQPGRAGEYVLLPMLNNHEVLSILLCDNPNTGKPLGSLSGLSLFLTQAGMALENASLHRKLRSLETQFSIENQGPLTQELTQIIRERK